MDTNEQSARQMSTPKNITSSNRDQMPQHGMGISGDLIRLILQVLEIVLHIFFAFLNSTVIVHISEDTVNIFNRFMHNVSWRLHMGAINLPIERP